VNILIRLLFFSLRESLLVLHNKIYVLFLQHPWRSTIRFVVDLEAMGIGGKSSVFQGGSVPWAIETYAKVSKYPSGLVISQDLFHSGAIQSATDFQVYEEVGGLSGLDFAYTDATAIYHTKKKKREKKKKEKRRTYLHQFPALSVARGRRITGEIRCLRVIPSPRAGRKDRGDRGRSRQEAKESRSEGGSFFFRKGFFKLPRFLMKRLAREIGPRNGGVKVGGRQLLLLRGLLQAVAVLDDKSTREVRTRSGGVKVRGGQLLP
ncbi:hypothetical protein GW17_00015826, partial [Ensete ventricosum]